MAAAGSLTRARLIEELMNMTREVGYGASRAARALEEGLEKALDYARESRGQVDRMYYRYLDFLANGGAGLESNSGLYLTIARFIQRAGQKLDAAMARLTLLPGVRLEEDDVELVRSLTLRVRDAAEALESQLGFLSSHRPEAPSLARRKFEEITGLEERVDEEYRRAIAGVLTRHSREPARMVILKEALDYLEDAVDDLYEAANYARVLGGI